MNIVSMALQYLAPSLIGKLASGIGLPPAIADKLVKVAVPVILGALAGKTASPAGARSLFDVLAKQDTGMLGRLSNVLGSPQQKTVAEQGTNVLGSLLGQQGLGALVGALTKFGGVGQSSAGGLVGMLAPIVLGTLGQQQKSAGLDAGGIAKLLSDQKSNIAAAIPSDLSKLLDGSGLLNSVMGGAKSAPVPQAAAREAPPVAAKPFNGWPWAALVAVASLIWGSLFSGPPAPWAGIPAPPRLMAGTTDVAGELDVALKGIHGLLSGIRDKTTAEQALPQLRQAQATIDRLDASSRQLPSEGKRILAGYVASWLPLITPLVTSLAGNSAVAPLIKPLLDGVQGRLAALAKG